MDEDPKTPHNEYEDSEVLKDDQKIEKEVINHDELAQLKKGSQQAKANMLLNQKISALESQIDINELNKKL